MPIRAVPFEAIDAALVASLRERRVREDRTLDFKRDLELADRDAQSEFLKDVTAFANGSGGTLLYGVEEGEGEDEGVVVGLPALRIEPDAVHRTIDNLLRDAVDERPMGVLHRAVPRPDGRYYYVVRVPPSPLAPHMVTIGKHRSKFFLRANTTSDPMDARQIKETSLRAASAFDRAVAVIDDRRRVVMQRAGRPHEEGGPPEGHSQLVLHVVPLFPLPGGFALAEDSVVERLAQIPILRWTPADHRFALEGLYISYSGYARAGYLRTGAAEFQEYDVLETVGQPGVAAKRPSRLRAWDVEQDVLLTLDACAGLTADGLLPLPLVVALTLTGVEGSRLQATPRQDGSSRAEIELDVVPLTPTLLNSWDRAAALQVRSIFDEMYQAWGLGRSTNYRDGKRVWWGKDQREPAPRPVFWASGWDEAF